MKRVTYIFFILFTLIAASQNGAGDQALVERIEFRGVKNIDRYDIIKNAGGRASGKGISVEIGNLKKVLDSNVMINNYDLNVKNGVLTVTVEEKYPLFMVLVADKSISTPCLVDENIDIVDTGRFFETDMPIITVDKGFYGEKKNSAVIRELLAALKEMRGAGNGLAGELFGIEMLPNGELGVKLKNRKTLFLVRNEPGSFKKIEKSAAYLDAVNKYPALLDLRKKRVLIRE